jgi:uncharacterized protein (DUF1697 family)
MIKKLTKKIEKSLSEKSDNIIKIVILTSSEMKKIIDKKSEGFGEEKGKYKYNVIFLIEPLKVKDVMKEIKIRRGVDNIYERTNIIYFSYLISKYTTSYISKVNGLEIYSKLSIRNWNTTEKLYEIMNGK